MAPQPFPESRHRESRRGLWVVLVLVAAVIAMGGLVLSMTRSEPRGAPPPEVRSTASSVDGESGVDATGSDYDAEAGRSEGRRDIDVESGETVLSGEGSSDVEGAVAVLGGNDDQPPPGTESADNRDVTAADSSALDEQLEAAGVPGLATRFVLSRESPHLGDALRGTIDFEVEDRDGVELPSQRALWRPDLAVLARFESPPSSALETNRWYQLGPPRGVDRGMPLPPARKSPYGSRVLVLVPLVYVRVLTPGREDENHTIWSGRLTEATGRVDLKVASLDEHGDVSLTYAATTFLVPPPDEREAAALAWLRSRGVVGALGTTAFDSGGPTLRATMSEFLEMFPDSRFRDEARYSLAVALEREGEDSIALSVLRGLSTEADDLALRAWAAVMAAQVHRGNGNKPGVLQVLAVTPDPGENAVLADQVHSLRRWANR